MLCVYRVQESIEVIETYDGKLKTEAQVSHDITKSPASLLTPLMEAEWLTRRDSVFVCCMTIGQLLLMACLEMERPPKHAVFFDFSADGVDVAHDNDMLVRSPYGHISELSVNRA
jgi:hypothetical protein